MDNLHIAFKFTDRAALLLPDGETSLQLAGLAVAQQPLLPGDKLRLADIPNCPWFIVSERYWDLGAGVATLTIWLDEPLD